MQKHDAYRCPTGECLTYRYTRDEDGKQLRRYWTTARRLCVEEEWHYRPWAAHLTLGA